MEWCEEWSAMREIPSVTVEGGDNLYLSIAAASILAKVARDEYIGDLCVEHPYLVERYGLDTNMGYGTRAHMAGIREYGITEWHRKSYAPCKIHLPR
jgi:ribonuclease HII